LESSGGECQSSIELSEQLIKGIETVFVDKMIALVVDDRRNYHDVKSLASGFDSLLKYHEHLVKIIVHSRQLRYISLALNTPEKLHIKLPYRRDEGRSFNKIVNLVS
jgi:hypothetical protein